MIEEKEALYKEMDELISGFDKEQRKKIYRICQIVIDVAGLDE